MSHNGLNVLDKTFLQHFLRCRHGGITVGKPPIGSLRVPYQTMTVYLQAQLLCIVNKFVSHTEVKDSFCRCQHLGFHAVLRHNTVKVLGKYSISLGYLSVTLPLVHSCTNKAILANGVLQTLLSHRCQWHHGQTGYQYLYFFIHYYDVLRFLC